MPYDARFFEEEEGRKDTHACMLCACVCECECLPRWVCHAIAGGVPSMPPFRSLAPSQQELQRGPEKPDVVRFAAKEGLLGNETDGLFP